MPPGVEHHDGFGVHTQIARGPCLEQLVERADPAGQHDERVGALFHDLLPFAHGVGDDQLVGVGVGDSRGASAFCGITPTVRPPRARAALATAPIADTWPPPHTSVQPRSAIASPSSAANSSNSGCVGPDAQYTQTAQPRRIASRSAYPKRSQLRAASQAARPIKSGGADSMERPSARVRFGAAGRCSGCRAWGRWPRAAGAVVLGPDGVGKSTLARLAAEHFASRHPERAHPLGHRHPDRAGGPVRRLQPPDRRSPGRHRQAGRAAARGPGSRWGAMRSSCCSSSTTRTTWTSCRPRWSTSWRWPARPG